MSTPLGQMGGYSYQSPEVRRLSGITPENYDYRDQTKVMSKLVNDVSYMAGMQRKMQKGIDDANQNFVQQIQALINDFLVILGGGGDTGLDFGDLKYILQAIGALFGFQPGVPLPLNLFEAAWHFFSNYIFPVDNFQEVINMIVDGAIATILDLFGEVPIVGQALQQLAQIVSAIRDMLLPIADAIEMFFGIFSIDLGDLDGIADLFGPLRPIWDALASALDGIELPNFIPMFNMIANWTQPFVNGIVTVIGVLAEVVEFFTGQSSLDQLWDVFVNGLLSIFSPLPAWNLFGSAPTNIFDMIGLDSLVERFTNYLSNPIFDGPESLINADRWSWDGEVHYPEETENGGSVYIDANGEDNDLCSNPINVSTGQRIWLSISTMWESLVRTGDPIALMAEAFYDDGNGNVEIIEEFIVEAVDAPAANGDWEELSGYYEVPDGANHVRLMLHVGSSATAGRVRFSNGEMAKSLLPNIVPLDWVQGLQETLSGIDEFVQGVVGFIGEAIEGIFNPFALLQELGEWIASWFDDTQDTAGNASDALGWLGDFFGAFSKVFGIEEQPTFAAAEQAVLDLNGRIVALEGGGVITTYTINGVWTNPTPAEHKRIKVIVYCGGDGGGRPSTNYNDQAKGGRSGGYVSRELWTDELPATVAMTIGAGGAGATGGGGDGNDGAITSFGSIVVGRKGVGAEYKDGAKLPDQGVPPGDGGRGAFLDPDYLLASSEGQGGAFAPGGRAGFGSSGSSINGKNGGAAAASEPSGGGGGGGGSAGSAGQAGDGGNGGFPGGAGGGAAKNGSAYGVGGNGAQGGIQITMEAS